MIFGRGFNCNGCIAIFATMVLSLLLSTTLLLSMTMLSTEAAAAEMLVTTVVDDEVPEDCDDVHGDFCGEIIMLEDFAAPKHKWIELNDPVMGGKSTGAFTLNKDEHVGIFRGTVEIVPFLNAPGFIKAETTPATTRTEKGDHSSSSSSSSSLWPDVSSCDGFQFDLKSSTPNYEGFRVSFGKKRPPNAFPHIYGFKSNMVLTDDERKSISNHNPSSSSSSSSSVAGNEQEEEKDGFQIVRLPFDHFTDNWDAGTGDPVVTCAENKDYCPDDDSKKDLYSIAVWGEGVQGDVELQIRSIAAYGCKNSKGTNDDSTSTSATVNIQPDNNDETSAATATVIAAANPSIDTTRSAISESKSDDNASTITIEDFANPTLEWRTMNDPVMGGRSYSNLVIENGTAHFDGMCAIVPFLNAPGFITLTTGVPYQSTMVSRFGRLFGRGGGDDDDDAVTTAFPDVSNCNGLSIRIRSNVNYKGYYLSFGTDRIPGGRYARGYKRPLSFDDNNDDVFEELRLPFTDFSSNWDDATGKTKVTCKENSKFCPSIETLRDMKTISFWGEGVEGKVSLEIQYIGAYGCSSTSNQPIVDSSAMVVASQVAVDGGGTTNNKNRSFSSSSFFTDGMSGFVCVVVVGLALFGLLKHNNIIASSDSRNVSIFPIENFSNREGYKEVDAVAVV